MSQTPTSLLERLSPQSVVCPLVQLGRTSPVSEQRQTAGHLQDDYSYNYYDSCNLNRRPSQDYIQQQLYYQKLPSYLSNEENEQSSSNSENLRHSPMIGSLSKQNPLDLSSLSFARSYWEHDTYNKQETCQLNSSPEYFRSQLTHPNEPDNYLLDNFTKLGKTSPSLDQGYHTLVSPSPGLLTPNLWRDNAYKGKKFVNRNNSFDRLPNDVIFRIFSYLQSLDLSVCARVCRRFEILAWTPTLWRTIILQGENIVGDKAIRSVLRQLCGQGRTGTCPNIEKVHLTEGAKLTDKGLLLLARRCPELTHLQIQNCVAITNQTLFEVTSKCHNLQHLDLSGCVQISCLNPLTGPEPPRRMQLQYLDLTDCPALQDSGLRIIVRNCPQLGYLYLRRCVQITGKLKHNVDKLIALPKMYEVNVIRPYDQLSL